MFIRSDIRSDTQAIILEKGDSEATTIKESEKTSSGEVVLIEANPEISG